MTTSNELKWTKMTFRSGVTAVSVKKSGWPVKKSSPLPLWEFRLPVKALALSARRPFRPARFARGLDKLDCKHLDLLPSDDVLNSLPPCASDHCGCNKKEFSPVIIVGVEYYHCGCNKKEFSHDNWVRNAVAAPSGLFWRNCRKCEIFQ